MLMMLPSAASAQVPRPRLLGTPRSAALRGARRQTPQAVHADSRISVFFETAEAERARDPALLHKLEEMLDRFGELPRWDTLVCSRVPAQGCMAWQSVPVGCWVATGTQGDPAPPGGCAPAQL